MERLEGPLYLQPGGGGGLQGQAGGHSPPGGAPRLPHSIPGECRSVTVDTSPITHRAPPRAHRVETDRLRLSLRGCGPDPGQGVDGPLGDPAEKDPPHCSRLLPPTPPPGWWQAGANPGSAGKAGLLRANQRSSEWPKPGRCREGDLLDGVPPALPDQPLCQAGPHRPREGGRREGARAGAPVCHPLATLSWE